MFIGKAVNVKPAKESQVTEEECGPNYFGKPIFLSRTSQKMMESVASALTNAYSLHSYFRLEKEDTGRHLAEFWMVDVEMCFAGFEELLTVFEKYVKYCIDPLFKNNMQDLEVLKAVHAKKKKV